MVSFSISKLVAMFKTLSDLKYLFCRELNEIYNDDIFINIKKDYSTKFSFPLRN